MKPNDIESVRGPDEPKVTGGLCRHIRCKGMYVTGEMLADPNAMPYDATVWWCTQTHKPMGPDFMPCGRGECVAGRKCFEAPDPT